MLLERDTELYEKAISEGKIYKKSHFFSSGFITRLLNLGIGGSGKYDYPGVRRWSKKFDVFSLKCIYFPINIDNTHWTMLVLNIEKKSIQFYDSMNGGGRIYLEGIQKWIVDEGKAKKDMIIDPNDWKLLSHQENVPKQKNGYDCGIFSCICADYLSDDLPLQCYSQDDMTMFRRKIGAAILRGSLDYTI